MNKEIQFLCIHPEDETTLFLEPIGKLFRENYIKVQPLDQSHEEAIQKIQAAEEKSIIIFLGHGTQNLLYSSETSAYEKKEFINISLSNSIFKNKNILLVSCFSADLINKFDTYNCAIGFGNIISSIEERNAEAELFSGKYINIDKKDIDIFNNCYVTSIKKSIKLLIESKINFHQLYTYIRLYLNKEINKVLLDKNLSNRLEIATLLFLLRDEIKEIKRS